ncbi:MAG: ABC transporter ATP-binding protein [Hungatella sp.]
MARAMEYKKPKNTKRTLLRLISYMGHHKLSMFIVGIMVIISSLANVIGTYMLKPVINRYIIPRDIPGLIGAMVVLGIVYLAGATATLGYNRLMVKTAQKIVKEIRRDLFNHTQTLPLSYFDSHTHGELMSRFTNDIDTIAEALNNSFTLLIQSFITTTGTLIMIVVLNARLSLIVLVCLFFMFLFIRFNGRRSRQYFAQQQKHLGNINGFIEEMVAGQKVEKVFNHEKKDFEEFCRRNEKLQEASVNAMAYSGLMVPVIVSISYINYAISACVGGLFTLAGLMDVGSLASYLVYVRQSAMPINQCTQQVNFILAALSGAERIFEMMDEQPEPDEGTITLCRVQKQADGTLKECEERSGLWAWKDTSRTFGSQLIPLRGDVRFEEVVFGYVPEKRILNGISLYAKPGQKIAFVGSTGAGKTTIINLINRFYEIQGGVITYDGIDITRIRKADLRRSLGFVLQDTHLFTGTIEENIRYGRLNATREDIEKAAAVANASSFIRRLPNGYQTMLNSDGANLSQGQRQLLAIARAAVASSPVLVLDEATSSIDTRTEHLIEQGMDALMENRTVFVIAHRLSTVRNSKAIMVLEHGQIMERGNHEELLEQKGRYYQLYTGQFELE